MIVMSVFGRTAESVVDRQQVSFFCLSKRKIPKKKTPEDLFEFTIQVPSHQKKNRHSLTRAVFHTDRAQTKARYDPVLL